MGVRFLRTILVVLLALAWAPLTAHCQLEHLTGSELLRCHCGDEAPVSDSSPCGDSNCCGWESGQYKLPESQPLTSTPLLFEVSPVLPVTTVPSENVYEFVSSAAPPELPQNWQFVFRAALPVRAPSFAS